MIKLAQGRANNKKNIDRHLQRFSLLRNSCALKMLIRKQAFISTFISQALRQKPFQRKTREPPPQPLQREERINLLEFLAVISLKHFLYDSSLPQLNGLYTPFVFPRSRGTETSKGRGE
jgi:hypothetical protein